MICRCVIAGAAVPGGVSRVIAFAIEVLPRVIKLSFPKQSYADRCFGQPNGHGPGLPEMTKALNSQVRASPSVSAL